MTNWLFQPSEDLPPMEDQLYLFMKRFRTQPSEFFYLDRDLRITLYKREYALMLEEYKKAQEAQGKSTSNA